MADKLNIKDYIHYLTNKDMWDDFVRNTDFIGSFNDNVIMSDKPTCTINQTIKVVQQQISLLTKHRNVFEGYIEIEGLLKVLFEFEENLLSFIDEEVN